MPLVAIKLQAVKRSIVWLAVKQICFFSSHHLGTAIPCAIITSSKRAANPLSGSNQVQRGLGHPPKSLLSQSRAAMTCTKLGMYPRNVAMRSMRLATDFQRAHAPKIFLSNKSGVFVVSDTRKHGMRIGRPETPLSISILRRALARRAISRWSSEKRI